MALGKPRGGDLAGLEAGLTQGERVGDKVFRFSSLRARDEERRTPVISTRTSFPS